MRDGAQTSIDFVTAISLFSIVCGFMLFNLLSVTSPLNYDSEIYEEAQRLSETLIESQGFWKSDLSNGRDWENHIEDVVYVGLSSESFKPNVLSAEKIEALAQENVSLNTSMHYRLEITSEMLGCWTVGEELPQSGEIAKVVRLVIIELESVIIEGHELAGPNPANDKVNITIEELPDEEIEIILTNFDESQLPCKIDYVKVNGNLQTLGDQFYLYINGVPASKWPVEISTSDTIVRIVIPLDNPDLDLQGSNQIEIKFVNYTIQEGYVSYEENRERILSKGVMTLWVWR